MDMRASLKISRLLKQKDLTLDDLAEAAGVDPSLVARVKQRPKHNPNVYDAVQISRALSVPAEWLWDNSKDWPPPDSAIDTRLVEIVGKVPDILTADNIVEACERFAADLRKAERETEQETDAHGPARSVGGKRRKGKARAMG